MMRVLTMISGPGVMQRALVLVLLARITATTALRDVELQAPSAVRLGDTALLSCRWALEGNETLYSVKWYRGRQEFFSYMPKEHPHTRIFPQPGIDVDISRSTAQQVWLRGVSWLSAGRFRCEVSADAPTFHTHVRSQLIHVVELPEDYPRITTEKRWYATGDTLRAQCTSPPARPPANLTWMLNGRHIQGQPVIQQRILPNPSLSIDALRSERTTSPRGDGNSDFVLSPWKTFGPFVDATQDGETQASEDTVLFPAKPHNPSLDEDVLDPLSTVGISNKAASVSQVWFTVRADNFERGQLRLSCVATVHAAYSAQAELVINEERPHIASVRGARDKADLASESLLLMLLCNAISLWNLFTR